MLMKLDNGASVIYLFVTDRSTLENVLGLYTMMMIIWLDKGGGLRRSITDR